jgi:diacylglycerol O-acyltransferase / wax synthase
MALNAYGKSGLANRLPMVANLVISNVPGAPVPLYLAGAQFLSFHPLSIIMHGLGLNITVQTYAGHVDFGIIADKKALPHANDLARAVEAAFAEAQALLGSTSNTVTNVTESPKKSAKLEASPSRKAAPRRDTLLKSNIATKTHAPNHGKPIAKKVSSSKKQS